MLQLLRREFLLKVLMTIGTEKLVQATGYSAENVLAMSLGQVLISETQIELIYSALPAGK